MRLNLSRRYCLFLLLIEAIYFHTSLIIKDVDKKMISLIGTEKKFLIAVKKVNEKTFFNVLSIFNYFKKI